MTICETYNVDSTDDLAITKRRCYGESGGIVPGRCAGYTYDGAAYCPACAEEVEVTASDGTTYQMDHFPNGTWDSGGFGVGVLSGFDEWDEPGATCHVCHKRLRTNIIRYDS